MQTFTTSWTKLIVARPKTGSIVYVQSLIEHTNTMVKPLSHRLANNRWTRSRMRLGVFFNLGKVGACMASSLIPGKQEVDYRVIHQLL